MTELKRHLLNVEAAIYNKGQWLLVQRGEKEGHSSGVLALVGGTVKQPDLYDHTLEKSLRREIQREVGLEVGEDMYYVESSGFRSREGQSAVNLVFLCEYLGGEPRIQNPREVTEVSWMTIEEILTHPAAPPWLRRSVTAANKVRLQRAAKPRQP